MLPTYLLLLVAGGEYSPRPRVFLDDADRLPTLRVCEENADFARKRHEFLRATLDVTFRESEVYGVSLLVGDADARWWLWDAARMARDPRSGENVRKQWLRYLRDNLTEEEWWTGDIPPPAYPPED